MPLGSPDSLSADPAAAPTLPAPPAGRSLFLTVFPSIMLPMFMAAVDQTIVATALPAIGATLGDLERVSWVVVGYLVANTIAAPVYGRLGDALGRRRMMFGALGVFVAASLFCAASTSVLMLSFARVLQGLGGGGLMTLSQALIAEAVPPRQRGRYQGYLSGMYAAAATFGPVVGGWLTEHYGWRSVFLVNLPLGALAVALVARLPAQPVRGGRLQFDVWVPSCLPPSSPPPCSPWSAPSVSASAPCRCSRSWRPARWPPPCCYCARSAAPPPRCSQYRCSASPAYGAPTCWPPASRRRPSPW